MKHVQEMLKKHTDMESDDFDVHTDDSLSTATLGTSPMAGVNYTTSSGLSGITSAYGVFTFNADDQITFSNANGQEIATITADDIGNDQLLTKQEVVTHAVEQNVNETRFFSPNDEGDIAFTGAELLAEYDIDISAIIDNIEYDGEDGLLTSDGDDNYTF
ncbi:MAG TPA: hypothetical protein EYH12_00900 [Psychromonas hadalis]|nr:hypothetical protein [Psychromonas hadalis]